MESKRKWIRRSLGRKDAVKPRTALVLQWLLS